MTSIGINKDGSVTVEITRREGTTQIRVTKAQAKVLYRTDDMADSHDVPGVAGELGSSERVVTRCVNAMKKKGLTYGVSKESQEDCWGVTVVGVFELTRLGNDVRRALHNIACESTLDSLFS